MNRKDSFIEGGQVDVDVQMQGWEETSKTKRGKLGRPENDLQLCGMSSVSAISLYNSLRKKIGEKETTELMEYVKSEVKSEFGAKACVFMTKDDKIELMGRASNDKAELIKSINDTKTELIERLNDTKTELIERLNGTKAELIERINDTKTELIERLNGTRTELIDRINKVKTETITWIVGVGVLQFVLSILSKKFL